MTPFFHPKEDIVYVFDKIDKHLDLYSWFLIRDLYFTEKFLERYMSKCEGNPKFLNPMYIPITALIWVVLNHDWSAGFKILGYPHVIDM